MFGTCSNYITLRLLGEELDGNAVLAKGRGWILSHGGATLVPQWGKIWLSVRLHVHSWIAPQHIHNLGALKYTWSDKVTSNLLSLD